VALMHVEHAVHDIDDVVAGHLPQHLADVVDAPIEL
jgi:hypothetical protein